MRFFVLVMIALTLYGGSLFMATRSIDDLQSYRARLEIVTYQFLDTIK